jgi:hypothetical protein
MNILPLHFYVNKVILYSMIKSKGDSGQSVVIGALLLLALFVAFISWFQITQVPILNQNAEAENNEMIRTEMFEFQEKSYDSILNDNVNQISFQTKVDYDYQISGFQDKIGQFSVTEFNETITVKGANKTPSGLPSSMISLKYTPSYIERTEIPFIYENGILIENQTTTKLDKGGQRFIRGNNIYMFEFETNFVALQSPRIVFVTVSDRDLQETIITGVDEDANNDGNVTRQDIKIELDTNLSVDIWKRLLSNQEHVKKVSDNGGSIIITLDGTEEYKVSTGKAIIEQ